MTAAVSPRWGIIGTANIARKNWKAIRNSGNSTLVAVASRDRAVISAALKDHYLNPKTFADKEAS